MEVNINISSIIQALAPCICRLLYDHRACLSRTLYGCLYYTL